MPVGSPKFQPIFICPTFLLVIVLHKGENGTVKVAFVCPQEAPRALVAELFESASISQSDADLLSGFNFAHCSCKVALEQTKYTADLYSVATLRKTVQLIPYFLQLKWAEEMDKLTQNGREPRFGKLSEFMPSKSGTDRSHFG